jgi:hypothetical protein
VRPDGPLAHAKHIVRAGLLLVAGLVALLLGRSLFVPETWGEHGSYRAANVSEQMSHPVMHGGNTSCRDCHADEYEAVAGDGHATLACELCHAPLAYHVADGDKIADMPIRKSAALCISCHQRMDARPASQPQINPRQHVEDQDEEYDETVCFDCHGPHEPF